MSAPNDGFGGGYPSAPQQFAQQPSYPEQAQGYEEASSPPPSAAGAHAADHGRKKKRAYAAQAFEVGQGGNVAAGGQLPAAGQFGAPQPLTPGYGGYPGQEPQAVPAYGGAPAYGVPQPGVPVAGAGGYQAPEPYYPSAAPGAAAGVGGITSGISGMQLGAGPGAQAAQPTAAQGRPVTLNPLYPTDLLNQPFNVSELDLPPPPIILPPNVSSHLPPPCLNMSSSFSSDSNRCAVVERYSVTGCQLPAEICAVYAERRSYNTLASQEVKAPFRLGHPTVRRSPRSGRPGANYSGPGHLPLQEVPLIH